MMKSYSSPSPSTSPSNRINIAASAQRLDVDNRISLHYYFRIADNILKQADIFREEKNIIDLYIMLLRFSSLVSETIPCHRDYKASLPSKNLYLKKRLLSALSELEELKPAVQHKINELNRKHTHQIDRFGYDHPNGSLEWPPVRKKSSVSYDVAKAVRSAARQPMYQVSQPQQFSHARPLEEQFRRMSLTFPRPKEETLSRQSILGPTGLYGHWQPPRIDKGVQYPSTIELTPVEIPSLQQSLENGFAVRKEPAGAESDGPQQSIGDIHTVKSECGDLEYERSSVENVGF